MGPTKPASKDKKPTVEEKSDDKTTYWITDEYGIRRQVEKDTKLTYSVDDYGHSHYTNDTKTKTPSKDGPKSKETVSTVKDDVSNDKTTYWITDEYGIRRQVEKDTKLTYS